MQEATDAFQAACKSGDRALMSKASEELVQAQLELDAAEIDAKARERVASGGRRRDKVLTIEQSERRNALFEALGVDPRDTQTPASRGQNVSIEIGSTYRQILDLWATACNTMGNSTVGRWMLISAIHRAGPPPGWEGEWPPKGDGGGG